MSEVCCMRLAENTRVVPKVSGLSGKFWVLIEFIAIIKRQFIYTGIDADDVILTSTDYQI